MRDVTDIGVPRVNAGDMEDERARPERLAREGVIRLGTGVFPEGFWDLPLESPKRAVLFWMHCLKSVETGDEFLGIITALFRGLMRKVRFDSHILN